MLLSKISLPCCLIPFFTIFVKYPAPVKSPLCGTFALLYCNYTEGRQPLPINRKKRGTLWTKATLW